MFRCFHVDCFQTITCTIKYIMSVCSSTVKTGKARRRSPKNAPKGCRSSGDVQGRPVAHFPQWKAPVETPERAENPQSWWKTPPLSSPGNVRANWSEQGTATAKFWSAGGANFAHFCRHPRDVVRDHPLCGARPASVVAETSGRIEKILCSEGFKCWKR